MLPLVPLALAGIVFWFLSQGQDAAADTVAGAGDFPAPANPDAPNGVNYSGAIESKSYALDAAQSLGVPDVPFSHPLPAVGISFAPGTTPVPAAASAPLVPSLYPVLGKRG